jgi:carbon starvation protein
MNGAVLLAIGCVLFGLAYRFYGRFVERVLGVEPDRPTPAVTQQDGIDYVPTRPVVLFGHHFASIAGAGPSVGPVLAAKYGWGAVALWIILGCIFIGAVHDLCAMFLSIRHKGRSIGTVIETIMGYWGRLLFLLFCLFALILVIAQFTDLIAGAFVSTPAVATALLLFITLAVSFGLLVYKCGVGHTAASFVFVPLMFACVYAGIRFPLDLQPVLGCSPATARSIWTVVLLTYCFAASAMPVWMFLQPCGYLNSFLLYAMMALSLVGIFVTAPVFHLEAFTGWRAFGSGDPVFPMLFVTVACGACSGFHALVASGTSAKQLASERHLRPVAYGGMLIEGVVALIALIAVCGMTQAQFAEAIAGASPVSLFSRGIAAITAKIGVPQDAGIVFVSLALAAFLITTLDTATRLARFTWQELFLPRSMPDSEVATAPKASPLRVLVNNRFLATATVIAITASLLLGGGAKSLWPVFASANQLLAALTLLGTGLWMLKHKKKAAMVLLPMGFMIATSGMAVVTLFRQNLAAWLRDGFGAGGVLAITTGCLMLMSLLLIVFGAVVLRRSLQAGAQKV